MQQDTIINSEITTVKADFWISAKTLNFDSITNAMGMSPDEIQKKEDIKAEEFKKDSWCLSTGHEQSDDIEVQMSKIQERLRDKINVLSQILLEYNAECGLNIVVNIYNGEFPLLVFSRETMKFWARINAEVGFDMYFMSDYEET